MAHILTAPYSRQIEALLAPAVWSIDPVTMQVAAATVKTERIGQAGCDDQNYPSIGTAHAALSPDGRFLVTNRWTGSLNVVDLLDRKAWVIDAPGLQKTGGIDFNYADGGNHLLAVHGIDRIGVYKWNDGAGLSTRAIKGVFLPQCLNATAIFLE